MSKDQAECEENRKETGVRIQTKENTAKTKVKNENSTTHTHTQVAQLGPRNAHCMFVVAGTRSVELVSTSRTKTTCRKLTDV